MDASAIEVNHFEEGGFTAPNHTELRSRRVGHELPLGEESIFNATKDGHHDARFDFAAFCIFCFDADFAVSDFGSHKGGSIAIDNQLATL
jgi:hypothetical protein